MWSFIRSNHIHNSNKFGLIRCGANSRRKARTLFSCRCKRPVATNLFSCWCNSLLLQNLFLGSNNCSINFLDKKKRTKTKDSITRIKITWYCLFTRKNQPVAWHPSLVVMSSMCAWYQSLGPACVASPTETSSRKHIVYLSTSKFQ